MAIRGSVNEELVGLDTLPKILYRNFLQYGDRVAMRKKNFSIWQEYTWKDVFHHVERIYLGLCSLGAKKDDKVIIIGNNDPELVWIQWAAEHAQLISVCLYVDYLPDEVKYFVNDCQAKLVVCEDQEQVDKIIRIKGDCPSIEKVIYWDPKGLWFYNEPYLISLESLEELGERYGIEHPELFKESISKVKANDIVVFMYTSGTTGLPNGSIQTHTSLLEYAKQGFWRFGIQPWDEYLSYAPPAWVEQVVGMSVCPMLPLVMSFAEEPETITNDLREIGPHFVFYGGRQWEDLARQIRVKIDDTSVWKRFLFNQAMNISYKRLTYLENGKPAPLFWRVAYHLADFAVLRQVRDYFGLKRARVCGSGGALTSPELPRFFRALGLLFSNMYGTVEAGFAASTNPSDTRYDSIGQPDWGKEIRIQDGQIWIRVGEERPGYWNKPGLWERKVKNGWYATGDAVWIDDEGYVFYIDRIDEMSFLKSGYHFSPQFVETKLRFSPYIKDAVVFGADEDYVVAIVSCDFGMVGKWAELQHIPYTTLVELSQLPPVIQLLREEIRRINSLMPPETRVRRFISLHKEFDPDEAELTRSRKLKRKELTHKYSELVRAMYEGKHDLPVETEVSYKDGRKGKMSAVLTVNKVDESDTADSDSKGV